MGQGCGRHMASFFGSAKGHKGQRATHGKATQGQQMEQAVSHLSLKGLLIETLRSLLSLC